MIQKKTSAASVPESKLPWPECFYTEQNPDRRRIMMEERLKAYEAGTDEISPEEHDKDLFRQKLIESRYTTRKERHEEIYIDKFSRAWMMMKVSAGQGIGLFNSGSLRREWHGYMKDLCIEDFSCANETEHELLITEWKAFLNQMISCCVSDKSYHSVAFGFIPLKEDALSEKIANEMELVTEEFPGKLGLKDQFTEFHQIVGQVYSDSPLI